MAFGLKLTTAPATELITTALAKTYLHVVGTNEDTLIDTLVTAARTQVEEYTGRALINQTWDLYLDGAPFGGADLSDMKAASGWPIAANLPGHTSAITLPRPPLSSITSISSFAPDNTETTYSTDNYRADTVKDPGRAVLNDGESWPTGLRETQSLRIVFVAGYGAAASSVPNPLLAATYEILYDLYRDRGSGHDADEIMSLPTKTERALRSWRVGGFVF
tara:strand:+ start:593 stop:1252 length:660 start_codon:yes stop_codon:yes gene_type:complete